MDYKCKLTISVNKNDEIKIGLDNPGEVSPLFLCGALDFVKFGLQSSMSHDILDIKEDENGNNSI